MPFRCRYRWFYCGWWRPTYHQKEGQEVLRIHGCVSDKYSNLIFHAQGCFCLHVPVTLNDPLDLNITSWEKYNTSMLSFHPLTEPSRRPKKSLAATSTSPTLKQMLMIRVRRRKKTRMKRVGTDPRSRQRGGKGGRAFLRSTSPAS